MPDDAQPLPTLSEADQGALQRWVRQHGLGSTVTDVEPLTGGTQNIVVRVHVDGRPMVLRRPPLHPRPTSDKTMLREIAALRTLAGTEVPHPGARSRSFFVSSKAIGTIGTTPRRLALPTWRSGCNPTFRRKENRESCTAIRI
jgi:hypothetical protein